MQEKLEQIQDLVKKKKVVFASQDKISTLQPWLNEIRKALHIKSWWISDESTIGDFSLSDKQLQELRDNLGVDVNNKDYLVDVAEKMKNL